MSKTTNKFSFAARKRGSCTRLRLTEEKGLFAILHHADPYAVLCSGRTARSLAYRR